MTMGQHESKRYAKASRDGQCLWLLVESDQAWSLSKAPWLVGMPVSTVEPPAGLLCPVEPSKIIGIGRNYRAHAAELGNDVPSEPLLFLKPPSSLLEPGGCVRLPKASVQV